MNVFDWMRCVVVTVQITAFGVYWTWCYAQFQKHRSKEYFVKRRSLLTLIQHCGGILWVLAVNQQSMEIILSSNIGIDETISFWITRSLFYLLLMITFGYTLTVALIRIWLLYFDLQLSRSLTNKSWQMAIDPNIESKNWFLNPKNQRIYGNDGKQLLFRGLTIDTIYFFCYLTISLSNTIIFQKNSITVIGILFLGAYFLTKVLFYMLQTNFSLAF